MALSVSMPIDFFLDGLKGRFPQFAASILVQPVGSRPGISSGRFAQSGGGGRQSLAPPGCAVRCRAPESRKRLEANRKLGNSKGRFWISRSRLVTLVAAMRPSWKSSDKPVTGGTSPHRRVNAHGVAACSVAPPFLGPGKKDMRRSCGSGTNRSRTAGRRCAHARQTHPWDVPECNNDISAVLL
jgi:hypothetical protein